MENEQLEMVKDLILIGINDKLENASLKNEYTRTLIKTISDDWASIAKVAEAEFHSENSNDWKTYHKVMSASRKIENLLNLTLDMLEEADFSNEQALKNVTKLNKKIK